MAFRQALCSFQLRFMTKSNIFDILFSFEEKINMLFKCTLYVIISCLISLEVKHPVDLQERIIFIVLSLKLKYEIYSEKW